MVGRCCFVLEDTYRGVKGKVGRASESQEHKHRVPKFTKPSGKWDFSFHKSNFQHIVFHTELVKFQAPGYHKVMRQLEGAQKTSEKFKCYGLQVAKNGRAEGAVMIWRVDGQGKFQHLQKLQIHFCVLQMQGRLLQKQEKNMISVSR